jgi:hypothetical protein
VHTFQQEQHLAEKGQGLPLNPKQGWLSHTPQSPHEERQPGNRLGAATNSYGKTFQLMGHLGKGRAKGNTSLEEAGGQGRWGGEGSGLISSFPSPQNTF